MMELEQDLKVANVICMVLSHETLSLPSLFLLLLARPYDLVIFQNGRRHISSSKNEVSRDLVVNVKSKKKQALLVGACYCLVFVFCINWISLVPACP